MTDSRWGSGETPEELASALRDKARSAAATALRAGLEDIEDRHGQHVADAVAALVDVDRVFAGLTGKPAPARRRDEDDDEPYEFRPVTSR
ncbi:hypothetical protein [Amycolatopsis kentuckyensis]|uniref:hypothetical protein n=1 Tax=Amycolatopsis kentuckyensis TaxID=218823 RepID=UPI0011773D19|nr:hypothetical protein [Amycolatopsis kentuckyensis]